MNYWLHLQASQQEEGDTSFCSFTIQKKILLDDAPMLSIGFTAGRGQAICPF